MLTDKQVILQAILPLCLFQLTQGGMKGKVDNIEKKAQDLVMDLIKEKDQEKILRRLGRIAHDIYLILRDKSNDTVHGHKAILAFYDVAQKMLNIGFAFDKRTIRLIDEFLILEAKQDTDYLGNHISDADWIALKKSADKAANKIFDLIKEI